MGFNDREKNRKSVAASMISDSSKGNDVEEKEKLTQKSYYLSDDQIKALALESAISGKDKSEIVREALEERLAERLKEIRKG